MKKRVFALFLALVIAVSLTALPASAAFNDVSSSDWFAQDVEDVQQYGIIIGTGGGNFSPRLTLTLGQAVTMVARTYAKANGLTIDESDNIPWYKPYVVFAVDNGIMTEGEFGSDYDAVCSRLTMAMLYCRVFPMYTKNTLNSVTKLPDLPNTAANADVYFLYEQGVLTGNDEYGTFLPYNGVSRAEAAAILNRVLNPEKRKTFVLKEKTPADSLSPFNAALTVKYQGGTAADKWYVQEGGAAAPSVADINKDGRLEIIAASRTIYCLDAATGKILWQAPSGGDASTPQGTEFGRCTSDIKIADLDKDGYDEIVTVHTRYEWSGGQSKVAVYDRNGYLRAGWPVDTPYPVRGVEIGDFENDGRSEIALMLGVGTAGVTDSAPSLYVYEPNGTIRSGWPVTSDFGFYSDSLTFCDLNGDGRKELVGLFDAEQTRAWDMYGQPVTITSGTFNGLTWNGLPVAENYDWEIFLADYARSHGGHAAGNSRTLIDLEGNIRAHRNIIGGTVGGVVAADVDGNGTIELVFACMVLDGYELMQNPGSNSYEGVAKYYSTFILNTDRTRYTNPALGFNWTQMPMDPAKIVSLDSSVIPTADIKPVVDDIDGDGYKEILYSANDGQVHCWGLNGKQNYNWPFTLCTSGSPVKEFATRPVTADLNGDGYKEVIFGTYTQTGQIASHGSLYILDCTGRVLSKTSLPYYWAYSSAITDPNGCQAAPVVADVDGDGKQEIVLHTLYSGVVVYDVG